jgi:hypothetical protein
VLRYFTNGMEDEGNTKDKTRTLGNGIQTNQSEILKNNE